MTKHDRDRLVHKHPSPVVGTPVFVEEDLTGQYDGEELQQRRARRPTDDRLTRLEGKHDSLVRVVSDFRVDMGSKVGEAIGKLDAVLEHVTASHREQQQTERVRIGSRAKIIVGVVGALCTAIGAAVASMSGCA